MQNLIDILDREIKVYDDYLALAKEKKTALLINDMNIIKAISIEEKGLTATVLALEAARVEYLQENGFKPYTSMEEVFKTVKSKEEKTELRSLAQRLHAVLLECKKFNEENMELMRESSNYINHMIKTFSRRSN